MSAFLVPMSCNPAVRLLLRGRVSVSRFRMGIHNEAMLLEDGSHQHLVNSENGGDSTSIVVMSLGEGTANVLSLGAPSLKKRRS